MSISITDQSSQANPGWVLHQHQLPDSQGTVESLLSVGNGFLGTRGTSGYLWDEPYCEGTYINGAYVRTPIHYDESAYGFARFNNKMLQVPDTKAFALYSGNKPFKIKQLLSSHLDLEQAIFKQSWRLALEDGKSVELHISRMACQHQPQMLVQYFALEWQSHEGPVTLVSGIGQSRQNQGMADKDDPRAGDASTLAFLQNPKIARHGIVHCLTQRLEDPAGQVITAFCHCFDSQNTQAITPLDGENYVACEAFKITPNGGTASWTKYSHYAQAATDQSDASEIAANSLQKAAEQSFQWHQQRHSAIMQSFWDNSNIEIQGNARHQLAIRTNMLHLFMSAGRDGQRNIGAKGLSGPGYDGHYFWDSEMYIVPYFAHTRPQVARSLISYRFNRLQGAKERALELGLSKGVLFPWRTIGGEECSSYYPAGTAQYHINAAIGHAVKTYFSATNDLAFMWDEGARLVFETARLWPQLGHFNPTKGNQFCIDCVTGPDEYTAVVNNNYYTNVMAKMHLQFAVDLVIRLAGDSPQRCQDLLHELGIDDQEVTQWSEVAKRMYLPYDKQLGIMAQDDSFLGKKPWDLAATPKDKFPLLLHYHPLEIYRHQVLKQADVVLADLLRGDEVEPAQKLRNLAYYEPLTTHDSTLSACIHSIANSEAGQANAAFSYFEKTLLTDLDNLHNNSHYGLHTAAMAGSWLGIVQGFAGVRLNKGQLRLSPTLPAPWQSYQFKYKLGDCQLRVRVDEQGCTVELLRGEKLSFQHQQTQYKLSRSQPVQALPVAAEPVGSY